MNSLNYLTGHILYQIFNAIWVYHQKKNEAVTDNPSIMIYINKMENRTRYKLNRGYYLVL